MPFRHHQLKNTVSRSTVIVFSLFFFSVPLLHLTQPLLIISNHHVSNFSSRDNAMSSTVCDREGDHTVAFNHMIDYVVNFIR